jgi:hypothetical protein
MQSPGSNAGVFVSATAEIFRAMRSRHHLRWKRHHSSAADDIPCAIRDFSQPGRDRLARIGSW